MEASQPMSEINQTETPYLAEVASSPRGYSKLAWMAIVVLVALTIWGQRLPQREITQQAVNQLQRNILEIQGQYLVAASQMPGGQDQKRQLYESARALNSGPWIQRLAFVVLAGELVGPDEALRLLDGNRAKIRQERPPVPQEQLLSLEILSKLYSGYQKHPGNNNSLRQSERDWLQRDLGWFGTLALTPARPNDTQGGNMGKGLPQNPERRQVLAVAWRTLVFVILGLLGAFAMGAVGLVGAVLFAAAVVSRRTRSAVPATWPASGIYAETFALWMLLLTGLSVAAIFLPGSEGNRLFYSSGASLLSLSALAWPLLRGVSGRQLLLDTGLYGGTRPWREFGWGVVCYVSNLPIVAIGFVVTLILFRLQALLHPGGGDGLEGVQAPAHPIIEWVREAGIGGRLAILILACVIAPVVEETLFRGVLYRDLRERTACWKTSMSVVCSGALNSLIFAIIHPQGLLAAPVLMAIAFGLSLAREWRGSLIASMTMHGINNGIMLLMLLLII